MKRYLLIFAIVFPICFTTLRAQDIHFSQFTETPLTVNPALAGTTAWIRAALAYRSQWGAVTVPYKTFGASFDVKSKKRWTKVTNETERYRKPNENGFGWGVNIFNDRAGDGRMNTFQANGTLAYQIISGENSMLAMGFQAGILQRSINFNKLNWGNQYDPNSPGGYNPAIDPRENLSDNSLFKGDIAAGMTYSYKVSERYSRSNDQKEFVIGIAGYHLNQPKYSFIGTNERLAMRGVFYASGDFGIQNTNLSICPAFLYQRQGPNQEIVFGSMFKYMRRETSKVTGFIKGSTISAGGYYRYRDSFVAAFLFETNSYGIGFSYDINVSGLAAVTYGRGGFEITLRYLNPSPFVFSQAKFGK